LLLGELERDLIDRDNGAFLVSDRFFLVEISSTFRSGI
jgi:hypothetical protein